MTSRTHSNRLEVNIASGHLEGCVRTMEIIREFVRRLASKEVPKMESLTKDIFYKARRVAKS
jgi:hypothetical protein